MSDAAMPDAGAAIRLHDSDNIMVALKALAPGAELPGGVTLRDTVPAGHKVAVRTIGAGDPVRKYGQIIGSAIADIAPGAHVHVHNLGMGAHKQDYGFGSDAAPLPAIAPAARFRGYHRPSGRVGTRNYIGILTSVNCAGSVARFIAEEAARQDWLGLFPNVNGIVPIVHGTGCGMSGKGEGYETLFRTLAGYGHNPNFGAILMVGLGCEVMQIPDLIDRRALKDSARFRYMTIQQTGGTRATVDKGVALLRELAAEADRAARADAPASGLVLGMQCGGSDGYSGITANPALGHASDLLVRHGGTSILSETSEIYGAEHLLTRRAIDAATGRKLIDLIDWWEDYTARNYGEMDNNPSPGNKRGGLTTILEKSLGAVAKGGTAPLSGVYKYAEAIDNPGFVFMDSPGYDPCSVTGQVASGANLIAFTTGRGSVSGYRPVPCIKIASNPDLWRRMGPDMDVNCGDILDGVSLEAKGQEIFNLMLRIASGDETKSEAQGFGAVEFVPWQIGAVM
ncbi:UxaA family hydrolase [Roseinatronobacter alkalisoli]|uniref:Altronate dehydratase family protein n=1 Tax=Roseinatronobacter alkalisoli TaxID=3028235 RepID=A0ABT5TIJ9_9RHOB|nr:altronate dehydratase family protein [Roseinatronobacter sp. HJB301]MDD7973773.1 altronate dehydratase family protein [Roseinatronobacter sp. HJB301]